VVSSSRFVASSFAIRFSRPLRAASALSPDSKLNGAGGFTMNGSGTLTLGRANTYAGASAISHVTVPDVT